MPRLLLTRPQDSAEEFALLARDAGWHGEIVLSPLIQIALEPLASDVLTGVECVIATSQHAIAALVAMDAPRDLTLWCVGARTRYAAQTAGFTDLRGGKGGDGESLLAEMLHAPVKGGILHLHGEHLALNLAARLSAAGHAARGVMAYRQAALGLSQAGQTCLTQTGDVVIPLFSPRSAALLAHAWAELEGPRARLHLILLSQNVAKAAQSLPAASTTIATHPDGAAIIPALLHLQAVLEAAENPR